MNLNDLYDQNTITKQKLFELKGRFYPANNPNIKNMTFIRLINQSIGNLECISRILQDEIRTDTDRYLIQICSKCWEETYHRINKTTANCVVCNKRNKIIKVEEKING